MYYIYNLTRKKEIAFIGNVQYFWWFFINDDTKKKY